MKAYMNNGTSSMLVPLFCDRSVWCTGLGCHWVGESPTSLSFLRHQPQDFQRGKRSRQRSFGVGSRGIPHAAGVSCVLRLRLGYQWRVEFAGDVRPQFVSAVECIGIAIERRKHHVVQFLQPLERSPGNLYSAGARHHHSGGSGLGWERLGRTIKRVKTVHGSGEGGKCTDGIRVVMIIVQRASQTAQRCRVAQHAAARGNAARRRACTLWPR